MRESIDNRCKRSTSLQSLSAVVVEQHLHRNRAIGCACTLISKGILHQSLLLFFSLFPPSHSYFWGRQIALRGKPSGPFEKVPSPPFSPSFLPLFQSSISAASNKESERTAEIIISRRIIDRGNWRLLEGCLTIHSNTPDWQPRPACRSTAVWRRIRQTVEAAFDGFVIKLGDFLIKCRDVAGGHSLDTMHNQMPPEGFFLASRNTIRNELSPLLVSSYSICHS